MSSTSEEEMGGDCLSSFRARAFLPSTSMSASDIWEFVAEDEEKTIVFCKVFVALPQESPGLHYEAGVYEYLQGVLGPEDPFRENFVGLLCVLRGLSYGQLVEKVVGQYGVTPTMLLRNLMIMQCGEPGNRPALTDQRPLHPKDIPDCSWLEASHFTDRRYTIIVTKKPPGVVRSLKSTVEDPRLSPCVKRATLAATVLAIENMHARGLSHNDQHWENILTSTTEEPDTSRATRRYRRQGRTYEIPSGTRPLLFDWDRSQRSEGPRNPELRLYREDGLYRPAFCPERDWLTFFRELCRYEPDLGGYPSSPFSLFFQVGTPEDLVRLWRSLVKKKDTWAFARSETYRKFAPYIQVDVTGLLRFLGYSGVDEDAQGVLPGSPLPGSPRVARERYGLPSLLVVDWASVQKLLFTLGSWDQAFRLAQNLDGLHTFLLHSSAAYRNLQTRNGQLIHRTRLGGVVESLGGNRRFRADVERGTADSLVHPAESE